MNPGKFINKEFKGKIISSIWKVNGVSGFTVEFEDGSRGSLTKEEAEELYKLIETQENTNENE